MTFSNSRISQFPIDTMFLDRWSPRSFSGESIHEQTLFTILEAATWAPSASNRQPWRFIYFLRDDPEFEIALDLLDEGNRRWVVNTSALIFLVSDTLSRRPDGSTRPLRSHSFDTGAAWAMLALQALKCGFAAHAMGGVDFARGADILGVSDEYRIEAAIAVGRVADREHLPEDLRSSEVPSGRRSLDDVLFRHVFKSDR